MRDLQIMSSSAALVTVEEFARIPDDDHRYELVDGRVVRMSPPGSVHGALTTRMAVLLGQHADANDAGIVLTSSGFTLATNPGTVREPDVAFVRRERVSESGLPEGFWSGPPDLAIEIRSPGDRPAEVAAKAWDYLARGVPLVWVVDPRKKTVTVYRPLLSPVTLAEDEVLNPGEIVPGFTCQVSAIFR